MTDLKQQVMDALETVIDPCSASMGSPLSVVDMGMVTCVEVNQKNEVSIGLRPTSAMCTMIAGIMQSVETTVEQIRGVASVSVFAKSDTLWSEADLSEKARQHLNARRATARSQLKIEPYELKRRRSLAETSAGN